MKAAKMAFQLCLLAESASEAERRRLFNRTLYVFYRERGYSPIRARVAIRLFDLRMKLNLWLFLRTGYLAIGREIYSADQVRAMLPNKGDSGVPVSPANKRK